MNYLSKNRIGIKSIMFGECWKKNSIVVCLYIFYELIIVLVLFNFYKNFIILVVKRIKKKCSKY